MPGYILIQTLILQYDLHTPQTFVHFTATSPLTFYDVIWDLNFVAAVYVTVRKWLSQYGISGVELKQHKMSIFQDTIKKKTKKH